METIIANMPVNVNEQGYLQDMNQWNKEIAEQIADEEAIDLTNRHWEVLEYLRAEQVKGTALSIRKIGKSGVVGIAEFYKLFPEGPLKKASRIAGIPKPASCI
ncbi:TusE/DsrC/DsvC family sulfur relay protein [Marinoscillum sp.]|uniref:TusE/DsrC/DsvC family sulfur relay protein n=1 Tax=Marinoscillum sp. TaxID=2024838 RepID=UPI003BAD985B